MTRLRALAGDLRGASAIEFALAFPVLLILTVGILQLGVIFNANAGLRQAVEEGARYSTIYPTPSDSAISAYATSRKFGLQPSHITGPTISHGTTGGYKYVDLSMSYAVPLDFVIFKTAPVTLSYSRRAYRP